MIDVCYLEQRVNEVTNWQCTSRASGSVPPSAAARRLSPFPKPPLQVRIWRQAAFCTSRYESLTFWWRLWKRELSWAVVRGKPGNGEDGVFWGISGFSSQLHKRQETGCYHQLPSAGRIQGKGPRWLLSRATVQYCTSRKSLKRSGLQPALQALPAIFWDSNSQY